MKTVIAIALFAISIGFTHAQNVGIGTTTPTNKLHVSSAVSTSTGGAIYGINTGTAGNGILGISHSANTNGVQGISNAGTGVLGYSNDFRAVAGSSIGGTALYGNSTSGYGLDINGKVKISGGNTSPVNGAVLTSVDANGNAVWKQRRIAFNAGGVVLAHVSVPNGSARRVQFGIDEFYDLTQSYNLLTGAYGPTSSSFIAPVDGIYHFDIGISMYSPWELNSDPQPIYGRLTFKRNSGGVVTEMAEAEALLDKSCCSASISANISRDVFLKAGDFVYVEIIQSNEEGDTYTIEQLPRTYFNGHIVIAL